MAESQWVERRLIGSVLLNGQGVYVSVVTFPSGRKSLSLSVSKRGEPARGLILGPLLARTVRDLIDAAIGELGDHENGKDARDQRRLVADLLRRGTHGVGGGTEQRSEVA